MRIETEVHQQRVIRQTRRVVVVVGAVVAGGICVGILVPVRDVGHTWAQQDVVECQGSAFVGQARATGGPGAAQAAMHECTTHRRAKRWGPWGAFGNADDTSKYTGADD